MKKTLLILFLLATTISYACSCTFSEFGKRDYAYAKYIVKGKVMNVEIDQINFQRIITFKVSNSYKDKTEKIITVKTALDGSACGLNMNKGEKWLLFIDEQEGEKFVGLCGKNVRYNRNPSESKERYKKNCKVMKSYVRKLKQFENEQ